MIMVVGNGREGLGRKERREKYYFFSQFIDI